MPTKTASTYKPPTLQQRASTLVNRLTRHEYEFGVDGQAVKDQLICKCGWKSITGTLHEVRADIDRHITQDVLPDHDSAPCKCGRLAIRTVAGGWIHAAWHTFHAHDAQV
jgi:hypothetical protein